MQPSSRAARIAASFVDSLLVAMFNFAFQLTVGKIINSGILVFLILTCTGYGYYVFFIVTRGATLGKMFFGLKVVSAEGDGKISFGKALIRETIGKFISVIVLGLGDLWILWDKDRQGWHDKIAKTKVLQVTPLTGIKKVIAFILVLILPILAVLGIVLSVLLVAINPAKQFSLANNTKRVSDVNALASAIVVAVDEKDMLVSSYVKKDGVFHEIAKNDADLCALLVPTYLLALPVDPDTGDGNPIQESGCSLEYSTGYQVKIDSDSTVTVKAPKTSLGEEISATRDPIQQPYIQE